MTHNTISERPHAAARPTVEARPATHPSAEATQLENDGMDAPRRGLPHATPTTGTMTPAPAPLLPAATQNASQSLLGVHVPVSGTFAVPFLPHDAPPDLSGISTGRTLTREDFKNPRVLAHCGAEIGRVHNAAASSLIGPRLYLAQDAENRWNNVKSDPTKAAHCQLDLQQVDDTLAYLENRLTYASSWRVHGDFNYYPGAMMFDGGGKLENSPDDPIVGFHAFFEPLARLAYTARLDDTQMQTLLGGYTDACGRRKPHDGEMMLMRQTSYLFNLLYYAYFLDVAFTTPTMGTESGIERAQSLSAAQALLIRLRADQVVLAATGLPTLDLPPAS